MKKFIITYVLSFACSCFALAQIEKTDSVSEKKWQLDASLTWFIFGKNDYQWVPDVKVDNGKLHLQARYNYEDINTTSLWAGYNLETGNKIEFKATPMISGIVGNSNGMAPGLIYTLTYKHIEWYTESEYFFSFDNKEDQYFYASSDLSFSFNENIWAGIEGNRSRIFNNGREVQYGLLAGGSYKWFILNAYAYDIGTSDISYALSFEVKF